MPLINQTFDYLPDIDLPPSPTTLESIKSNLQSQIPASTIHPSLPPAYTPRFSTLMQTEHARLASGQQKMTGGIEVSRYEALTPPSAQSSSSSATDDTSSWQKTLARAYAAHTHLSIRNANLALLETYGRNAWLLHNAGLEKELEELEREVSVAKGVVDGIDGERSGTRAEVVGEFEVLEETWRMGVGRALEAEIAGEEVRRAVLERRRVLAGMEMRVGG